MAQLGPITIPQGCDYSLVVTVKNPDGSPKNLTGYAARFRVSKRDMSSRYIDITGSLAAKGHGSCTITSPTTGKISVVLDPHTPTELPTNNPEGEESILQANNVYSLVLIDASGKLTKVVQNECYTEAEL